MTDRSLQLPLVGDRLVVRDLVGADLADMHAYASDPEVARFLFWGPNEPEETEASLAAFIASQQDDPRLVYELGIALPADDRLIGALCLYLGDRDLRNDGELGFVLRPDQWGQGYVVEAARLLMQAAFQRQGLHRIWATCDARNLASQRVLEKLGMRQEASFVKSRLSDGIWIDEYGYAVLASEFS